MSDFLTKENISFILGLIGSIGTAITFLKSFINSRINFSIESVSFHASDKGILSYLMFINKSNQPLTITAISICINGIYYPAVLTSEEVVHTVRRSGKEIIGTHSEYSIPFPIVLSGQYATSGYVFFPLPKGTSVPSSKLWSVKVCTSKNKAIEKILRLDVHQ